MIQETGDTDNIIYEIKGNKGSDYIKNNLKEVWGKYLIYHVNCVPETDYISFYENLANELGIIEPCRPVNDKSAIVSKSRDIKPDPNVYHFYAAHTRQPLHTDYAYFPTEKSPDWVLMYCLTPSELGGITRLISLNKIKTILKKYNPELLEKLYIDIKWSFEGLKGEEIHSKPLIDGDQINWNYWQIKPEINNKITMKIREEFFKFLEEVIMAGNIYDFSKIWKRGDLIIFNDKKMLHGRDAFLGHRWLKDHAIFNQY